MHHGFVKVGFCTPEVKVADCVFNTEKIIEAIRNAEKDGVKLLVFPELCVTGYTCGDLFLQRRIIECAEKSLENIAASTKETGVIAAVGCPVSHAGRLYNCVCMVYGGKVIGIVPKKNLPNYSGFYEKRHFSEAPEIPMNINIGQTSCPFGTDLLFACREMPEFIIAAEVGEDLWAPCPPSVRYAQAGATVIVNCSASAEAVSGAEYRRSLVSLQSAKLACGYIMCNCGEGESTTDMVFGGHSMAAENGDILAESDRFKNSYKYTELDLQKLEHERRRMNTFETEREGCRIVEFSMPLVETKLSRKVERRPFVPEKGIDGRCKEIISMQALGLKKRLAHTNAKCAVIGISGGLDSTLALLVSAKAMEMLGRPMTDITAVTMPCFGTTEKTRSNAQILCEALGVTFKQIDIGKAVTQHFEDIGHDMNKFDAAYENSQARERTQVLMDLANKNNGLVVGTGDLSELALGWATYNGDHMSMYGVNASIPKTLIRSLIEYIGGNTDDSKLKNVLRDIADTPISPELLPPKQGEIAQKTEELVGPYELHDFFLYCVVRWGFGPHKTYRLAVYAFDGVYNRSTILKWLQTFYRRFFSQQFKRSCMPDGPKVGSVTLSPRGDWRMPSDASAELWLSELENLGK